MQNHPQGLTYTPASEFAQLVPMELPTGRVVLTYPTINLPALIATGMGALPNPLIQGVVRLILADEEGTPVEEPDEEQKIARLRDHYREVTAVVSSYVAHPVIVLDREPDPAKDEIAAWQLHPSELWALYAAAFQEVRRVQPFRDNPAVAGHGSDGEALQPATEPSAVAI